MNILYLRGFNNYHKRTIIKYSTLEDYQNNSSSFLNYSGINFNPNDGIVTELIVGSPNQKEDNAILMFEDNGSPDYCVCYESTGNSVTIKSRWFILESVRVRGGQYRLALKRDVIADHMDFVLRADCFIEKGQIQDINSPFLFNRENMTYNQIKKKEIPLYDQTGVPWIVGYIAKNYDTEATAEGVINNSDSDSAIDIEDTPFGNLTVAQAKAGIDYSTITAFNILSRLQGIKRGQVPFVTLSFLALRSKIIINNGNLQNIDNDYWRYYEYKYTGEYQNYDGPGLGDYDSLARTMDNTVANATTRGYPDRSKITNGPALMSRFMSKTYNGKSIAQNIIDIATQDNNYTYLGEDGMNSWNNQLVVIEEGGVSHYFTISIEKKTTQFTQVIPNMGVTVSNAFRGLFADACNEIDTLNWTEQHINPVYGELTTYRVSFVEKPAELRIEVTVPNKAHRFGCNDQLFDMFCIPYGELLFIDDLVAGGDEEIIYTRADAGLAAARAIAEKVGEQNIYDLQILPYCPIREIREAAHVYRRYYTGSISNPTPLDEPFLEYQGEYYIDSDNETQKLMYQRVKTKNTNNVVSYVFWCYESHGTFDLPILCNQDYYYQYKTPTSDILKKKISSETEFIRLCSPNYAGVFEYIPAKNNNVITYDTLPLGTSGRTAQVPQFTYFNVDFTYRPGNPYIHINPMFRGEDEGAVYGKDFNDVRGLICGGDFSLGYIVDAYRSYQIQNANFQAIFDRQIQNLDTNNAIAKEQTQFSSFMGLLGASAGGTVSGAMAGSKAGPYGAIAGAAVGGTLGTVGGVVGYELNMDWLSRQQKETRSYSIDMYNYHLGNIKALPYSISRTDCLTENSRLVPFIEVYQATETEVNNLSKVLRYNGLTVMTIDKPINYLGGELSTYLENAVVCNNKSCYFIKAKLIMNNDKKLNDDFHILDDIYAELDKGIYLQGK